jgi:hypothetical protein
MHKLTPALKGLITGILMICFGLIIFYNRKKGISSLASLSYVIYAAGIFWTLLSYRKTPGFKGGFMELFGQGFRCFIVITLVMVLFTAIFSSMHPEFAQEAAEAYRKERLEKKDILPAEIDETYANIKKRYTVQLVSVSIFGYLVVGTAVTLAGSALLMRRNQ